MKLKNGYKEWKKNLTCKTLIILYCILNTIYKSWNNKLLKQRYCAKIYKCSLETNKMFLFKKIYYHILKEIKIPVKNKYKK